MWDVKRRGSEILPLEWRQVDRQAQVVRREPGSAKNGRGRTVPYGGLPELVTLFDDQWTEHEALTAKGTICARVFHRHGKPIQNFRKAFDAACVEAGCPGRLPHDLRRTGGR